MLLALVTCGALCFQAPAFAGGRTVNDRVMEGNGVSIGVGQDQSPPFAQFDTTVPHVFSLRCDVATPGIPAGRPSYPDFLEITWNDLMGDTFTFKLKHLTTSTCSQQTMPPVICDPLMFVDPLVLADCFDTIVITGTGSLTTTGPNAASLPNCSNCGQLDDFRATDEGPPKTGSLTQIHPYDNGSFVLSWVNGSTTNGLLSACSDCLTSKADYRARQRGTCAGA